MPYHITFVRSHKWSNPRISEIMLGVNYYVYLFAGRVVTSAVSKGTGRGLHARATNKITALQCILACSILAQLRATGHKQDKF